MRAISPIFFVSVLLVMGASLSFAQADDNAGPIKSSPAYAEVLLRKTELQADLESLIADYTEANPKIIDLRFELAALNKSLERLYAVRPTETGKLTLALGKLLVKKAALDTDLNRLQRSYNKEHQEVRRAKRKVEIFEASINEVLR